MRGFALGLLGLTALYGLVGTRQGPARAAGLVGVFTDLAGAFLDPTRPAIPDLRDPNRRPAVSEAAPPPPGFRTSAGGVRPAGLLTTSTARPPVNYAL